MGHIEAIKEGFRLVNRVWQLVLVQLSMVFISGIGFFVFVGIPLAVAFILFSIDLTGITEKDIFQLLKEPSEIISKYFGIVLFVILGLLIYFLAAITFSIYVFGGSVGVIGRALEKAFSSHAQFYYVGGYYPDCCRLCIRSFRWWRGSAYIFCEESGFDSCPFSQPLFFSDLVITFIDSLSWNSINNHLWNCCAFH
jgi:hypothetical protein